MHFRWTYAQIHISLGRITLLLAVAAYIAIGLATTTGHHPWGDDWAQYVMHAGNIASGKPYSDIGYVFNPDRPNVGPPNYPPGLPLLLSPFMALFGLDIRILKSVCFICLVLGLAAAHRHLRTEFDTRTSLVAVGICAFHPLFWDIGRAITSEALFLPLIYLALRYTVALDSSEDRFRNAAVGALVGGMLYLCSITRSIGVTLLVPILLYAWSHRRGIVWISAALATFAVLVWLQQTYLVRPTTYSSELKFPTVSTIAANVGGYWRSLSVAMPLPFGLSRLTPAILVVPLAIYVVDRFRARKISASWHERCRQWVGCLPISIWFLATYFAALLLATIGPDVRYLIPVVPIVVAAAIRGLALVGRTLHLPSVWRPVVGIVALAYLSALHLRPVPRSLDATCAECMEMYRYVASNTAPHSIVAFDKPRDMALMTGRRSWRPALQYTQAELSARLSSLEIDYIVVPEPGTRLAVQLRTPLAVQALVQAPSSQPVFRNDLFTVYRLFGSSRSVPATNSGS